MATTNPTTFADTWTSAQRATWYFAASGSDVTNLTSQIDALDTGGTQNPAGQTLRAYLIRTMLVGAAADAQVLQNAINATAATAASAAAQATYVATKVGALVRSRHNLDSEITDHPVEEGADVADNVRARPIVLTVSGIVSDTPLGAMAATRKADFGG